ncbi:hypothetical protein AC578_4105 [Pseudocercospora eumusae]|uniref:Uncharacterized protein n=1 Tax=Pseudocercospora eumusae TaxID=321146 RepID=A0A139HF99_9PEZI|nr:hypothetical protein AC578_4105 [Pseudocercospora eumusae]
MDVPAYVSQPRFYGPKSADNNNKTCNELSLELSHDELKSKPVILYAWQKLRIGRMGIGKAKATISGKDDEAIVELVDVLWPWSKDEKSAEDVVLLRDRLRRYLEKDEKVVKSSIDEAEKWASTGLKYPEPDAPSQTVSASRQSSISSQQQQQQPATPTTPSAPKKHKKAKKPYHQTHHEQLSSKTEQSSQPPASFTSSAAKQNQKVRSNPALPASEKKKGKGKRRTQAQEEYDEQDEFEEPKPAQYEQEKIEKPEQAPDDMELSEGEDEDDDASSAASKPEPESDPGDVPGDEYMYNEQPHLFSESTTQHRSQRHAKGAYDVVIKREPASPVKPAGTPSPKNAFNLAALKKSLPISPPPRHAAAGQATPHASSSRRPQQRLSLAPSSHGTPSRKTAVSRQSTTSRQSTASIQTQQHALPSSTGIEAFGTHGLRLNKAALEKEDNSDTDTD